MSYYRSVFVLISLIFTSLQVSSQRSSPEKIFVTESLVIFDLCFSTYGEVLVVADNQTVKAFYFDDQDLIREFTGGHSGQIMAIDLSADSTLLASGGKDGWVVLWDFITGEIRHTFPQSDGIITSVSISTDNSLLAIGGANNKVLIYDLESLSKIAEYNHQDDVLAVKVDPLKRWVISAGADSEIAFYDLDAKKVTHWIEDHRSWIRTIDVNSDGTRLISADDRGFVYLWNLTNARNIRNISKRRLTKGWMTSASFLPDNLTYLVCDINGRIRIRTSFATMRKNIRYPVLKGVLRPDDSGRLIAVVATRGKGIRVIDGFNMNSKIH